MAKRTVSAQEVSQALKDRNSTIRDLQQELKFERERFDREKENQLQLLHKQDTNHPAASTVTFPRSMRIYIDSPIMLGFKLAFGAWLFTLFLFAVAFLLTAVLASVSLISLGTSANP